MSHSLPSPWRLDLDDLRRLNPLTECAAPLAYNVEARTSLCAEFIVSVNGHGAEDITQFVHQFEKGAFLNR